jgi:hypothetical protein
MCCLNKPLQTLSGSGDATVNVLAKDTMQYTNSRLPVYRNPMKICEADTMFPSEPEKVASVINPALYHLLWPLP